MARSGPKRTARPASRLVVATVAIAPLAVLAVGSGVFRMNTTAYDPPAATPSTPAVVAPAVPATTPALAVPATGPGAASPRRGIQPTGSLARTAAYTAIPGDALAAYQRAAAVINTSAPTCHLSWTLLGAIGRVESDHGQVSAGPAHGAIVGVRLNGRHGKRALLDTDGGELDGDARWDRAVGPFQFLPSTWRAVGVDADGDGKRDPQDIDDAALAASVYLCGSGEDLATPEGQRAALRSYNHSDRYVGSVLRVAASYAAGEQAIVSLPITYAARVDPAPGTTATLSTPKPKHAKPALAASSASIVAAPAPAPKPAASTPSTPAPAETTPSTPAPAETTPSTPPVDPPTPRQAAEQTCRDEGLVNDPAATDDAFDVCVAKELGQPVPDPTPTPDPSPTPGPQPSPDPVPPAP